MSTGCFTDRGRSSGPRGLGRPAILAVTSQLPWPLDRGGHLRTFHLLRALASDFRVRLVAGVQHRRPDALEPLLDAAIAVHPVMLGSMPLHREAVRIAAAAVSGEPYVLYRRHHHRAVWNAVGREIATDPADILYLDHLDSAPFAAVSPGTPAVVDLHNVYSSIVCREAAQRTLAMRLYLEREALLLDRAERRAVCSANAVFAVSEDDRQHFAQYGTATTYLVPNGVDCAKFEERPARRLGSPLLLYVGTMSWQPNVCAARYLAAEVFPRVRAAIPDARLRIVGRAPCAEVRALNSCSGVEVTGAVPDVAEHMREADVLVVPLEVGGGTRLKILEAFAAGLPVVSTPIGCEGLAVAHGEHLMIAPRDRMAAEVVSVLLHPQLSRQLAARARRFVRARYDWSTVGQIATSAVAALLQDCRPAAGPRASKLFRPKHDISTRPPLRILELRSVRGTGGGPEKTILLGAALANSAHLAITVCYVRDRRDRHFIIDARARELGIDYVEVPERHSFDPQAWSRLRRLVRDRNIDIVHAHDYKTDLLALLLSRADGVLPIATAHGWSGRSRRERVYYCCDRRVLARYPLVVTVSAQIRQELLACGADPRSVRCIPNGIDSEYFRRDPAARHRIRSRLRLDPETFVIGSVGRLEPEKRFDLLLEAAARVRGIQNLVLVIAGEGTCRADLGVAAARLGLGGRVRLLGHRGDIREIHQAFDVFVQTSETEGCPNAILEAMALQTPVVATRVGGTSDVIADGVHGLLVPPGNSEAVARAVERIFIDSIGTAEKVAAARVRIERELSFAARVRAIEELYAELAARRQRGQDDRQVAECA